MCSSSSRISGEIDEEEKRMMQDGNEANHQEFDLRDFKIKEDGRAKSKGKEKSRDSNFDFLFVGQRSVHRSLGNDDEFS